MENHDFLNWFQFAAKEIPAYQDYLIEHSVDAAKITNLTEFQRVPWLDKKTYILKYPLNMLFPSGQFPALGHASSGSSGVPTLWFRGEKQSKIGEKMHTEIFSKIFNIKREESTLVLICFAMGMWVAGNYTLMACHDISRKGYQLTTFSVGMDLEAISSILQSSAPFFKNVILIGYPFYLDLVFADLVKKNIPIPEKLFLITSGDKFSENWRENMLQKMYLPMSEAKRIVSIYGSSDAGILGFETPLSISIRQKALDNPTLYKALFADAAPTVLPTLVQYNPQYIFFEEINGELVLTTDLDCPLIRYNIHDRGQVISFSKMKEILSASESNELINYMVTSEWDFPFLVVGSKTDVSVVFEAVKIYPEQIKAALNDAKISHFLSGSFISYTKKNSNNETRLHFELELAPHVVEITEETASLISDCIVQQLIAVNTEYRNSYTLLPQLTVPVLSYVTYGSDRFKSGSLRGDGNLTLVNMVGKKSKVLT